MALLPVAEAQARLMAMLKPLEPELVTLADSAGRVLAQDLSAKLTQPPFDASAMDGFAVRTADVETIPVDLKVIEEIPAGNMPRREIGTGEAARLFTGSPVPKGADTVIMQENTTYPDDYSSLTINEAPRPGQHIRPRGGDFTVGEVLLKSGTRLLPRHITLAAAMNHDVFQVSHRPRVGVISSGDELLPAGAEPGPGQIIASNGVGLCQSLKHWGAQPRDFGIVADRLAHLTAAIAKASELDLIVTIGGASVGSHDHVIEAIKAAGGTINLWRVAMKPGKPVIIGEVEGTPLIGLPGNPVSAFVAAEIFLRPAVNALSGAPDPFAKPFLVRLASPLPATTTREVYTRATLEPGADGVPVATPLRKQDSSMLSALSQADILLRRPLDSPAAEAGDLVEGFSFD